MRLTKPYKSNHLTSICRLTLSKIFTCWNNLHLQMLLLACNSWTLHPQASTIFGLLTSATGDSQYFLQLPYNFKPHVPPAMQTARPTQSPHYQVLPSFVLLQHFSLVK